MAAARHHSPAGRGDAPVDRLQDAPKFGPKYTFKILKTMRY
jgi:hypothetical protein